jgi:hypothetical protein
MLAHESFIKKSSQPSPPNRKRDHNLTIKKSNDILDCDEYFATNEFVLSKDAAIVASH